MSQARIKPETFVNFRPEPEKLGPTYNSPMPWVITAKASQRNFVQECLYGDQKLQLCSTGNERYDEWSRYRLIITTTNWVRELEPVRSSAAP